MSNKLNSPLLADQSDYMLKYATLFFLSQRTYPEICTATIRLCMKYNKATEAAIQNATRVTECLYATIDVNKLVLCPRDMQLVSAADASYALHPDRKSHGGGVAGFSSDTSFYF
jgi:hypothetical protein